MSIDSAAVEAGGVALYASGIEISALDPGSADFELGHQFTELLFDHTGANPVDLIHLGYKPQIRAGLVQISDEVFAKIFPYLKRNYTSTTDYYYGIGMTTLPGELLGQYATKWKFTPKVTGQADYVIEKGIPILARSVNVSAGNKRVLMVAVYGILDLTQTDEELGQIGVSAT
uniref:Uncharacterized protein n=1 Tax=viral metagenome TaxID=1070528 RepID=A0A6H1ZRA2_9ZZZZ